MLTSNPFDSKSPKFARVPHYYPSKDIQIIEIGYNRVPPGLCQMTQRDVYILHYVVSGKGDFLGSEFDSNCGYLVVPNEFEKITADKKRTVRKLLGNVQGSSCACNFKRSRP